jgi:uncharacterized protein YndB with AHSA1/START domain/predicted enzyme related to lactoylglutathione lyase
MKHSVLLILIAQLINQSTAQNKMESNGKAIKKSRIINQSIDTVWWRWTTHEGLKTFFGSDNKIELTPGGAFEIYFISDNSYGSKGSEGCKVLSFLPGKYFSFSWNAPPQFSEVRNSDYKTWIVVQLNDIGNSQTEVTLSHLGWPKDERWTPVFDYFSKAWDEVMNSLAENDLKQTSTIQPNEKVTGVGGIFFKCKDPQKLKEWYHVHLGLNTDQWGASFIWWQEANSTKKGYTQWSTFSDTTKYFKPSKKDFMINYRVKNLEALVEELKKEGVTLTDKIEDYDYGKFIHIMDPEGNKIELWEPKDVE